jgi:hypothetical protein
MGASDVGTTTAASESSSSASTSGISGGGSTEGSVSTSPVDSSGPDSEGGSSSTSQQSGASESSTGAHSDDPASLCAAAMTEGECDGVAIEPGQLGQASCVWLDVHTTQLADDDACSAAASSARCMLFAGFLTGCGGGPGCPPPNGGQMYLRELAGGTVELLFYPEDDICGPLPTAAQDEPDWVDCGEPYHAACECICDAL